MFTQPSIQAQIKENIKAPRHWHLAQRTSNAENASIWWRHHAPSTSGEKNAVPAAWNYVNKQRVFTFPWHGNLFRITGLLGGFSSQRANNAELWRFCLFLAWSCWINSRVVDNFKCLPYGDETLQWRQKMGSMAFQITSLTIIYTTVYSGTDQRKHQSSASLAFVRGIHRWPVNSPHKWPVTRKMFPFDDVIINSVKFTCPQKALKLANIVLGSSSTLKDSAVFMMVATTSEMFFCFSSIFSQPERKQKRKIKPLLTPFEQHFMKTFINTQDMLIDWTSLFSSLLTMYNMK